jgi:probable selenium-dependent hydroxylase accessory protein YqeC
VTIAAGNSLLARIAARIPAPSLVSITGGGGKTALLEGLARHWRRAGWRVIATTTTKICVPTTAGESGVFLDAEADGRWRGTLKRRGEAVLGERIADGKMYGVAPAFLDRVYEEAVADHLVVEADGARRMPFKAFEAHEPVLPSRTTIQLVVVGAEVLFAPFSAERAFRPHLLEARYGLVEGERIAVGCLARILDSPEDYARGALPGVPRLLLVNKCDLFGDDPARIDAIADDLPHRLRTYAGVFFGSLQGDRLFAERGRGAA